LNRRDTVPALPFSTAVYSNRLEPTERSGDSELDVL
jgi:hypothetical protein